MAFPNPLFISNNHFVGHRRAYSFRTRLAIAADLGFQGFEFHPIEPNDDKAWAEASDAYRRSGLQGAGMYVVAHGCRDEESGQWDEQVDRVRRIVDRLSVLEPRAHLSFSIASNPAGAATPDYRESGSAKAEPRHWERAQRMLAAVDAHLALRGLRGNLYNHVWFIIDTPAAELQLLSAIGARVIRPGLALFHTHFHPAVPDLDVVLAQPGMDRLGYVAVHNGWPKPADPFRTRPLDDGNIDLAGAMGLLWSRGYAGPVISQGYDLGGDAFETARRSRDYLLGLHARFERNPRLNPWFDWPAHE